MIQLNNITKTFFTGKAKFYALNDISIIIKQNSFTAIVGRSGSGKSTLLHLIGNLETPTSGEIIYNGLNICKFSEKEKARYRRETVGFVFQDFNLKDSLNSIENILLPTYFSGKYDPEYANLLLKEVGLGEKKYARVKELSGGQKQRIAIARALINKPRILMADEPTGNLDTKTGNEIIELLKKIHEIHETTIIIATHDREITKIADQVITIENGKLCC